MRVMERVRMIVSGIDQVEYRVTWIFWDIEGVNEVDGEVCCEGHG